MSFRSVARIECWLIVILAALLPSLAFAQASPSAYTSAARYDAMRRVTGTLGPDPDGAGPLAFAAVRNTYDTAGNLTRQEIGELSAWQSESVAPASWPAASSPGGAGFYVSRTTDTTYDMMGRKTLETVREGAAGTVRSATQYSYDVFGRLECTAVRMNPAIFGSLPASACALGTQGTAPNDFGPDRISRNVYDAAGRRAQVREGVGTGDEGTEATWAYNAHGQITTVIDGNGNRAELRYDGHGRQDRWTFPSATGPSSFSDATPATALATAGSVNASDYEEYGYDPNGNRTSLRKRDGASAAYTSGNTMSYTYDAINRMTVKAVPERSDLAATHTRDVYYSYDLRGLQLSARFDSQSGEGITNTYDGFGHLASTSTNMGSVTRTLTYLYDANGNRIRITHPDSQAFSYVYDGLNRLRQLDEGAGGGTMLGQFAYNSSGQLGSRTEQGGSYAIYGHDALGRLDSLYGTFSSGPYNVVTYFGFNPASQIVSAVRDNDAYAWSGHYAVNRGYTTNGLNQYSAAGSAAFSYDLNGNLISDGANTYVYDVENRLVSASGAHTAALTYDPLGRLWQVANSSTTTRLLNDGDALVAEYNGSNALIRRYVHGSDAGADDPLVWYEIGDSNPRRWLHADERGSIVAVLNGSGQAIAINTYDEYGIPNPINNGRFQYTGQAWLPELGMYYYKARIYSPTLGRFMQTDPIAYEGGINLYEYVGNDPVNSTDPTGQDRITCTIAIGNGASATCTTSFDDSENTTVTYNITQHYTDAYGRNQTTTSSITQVFQGSISQEGVLSRIFLGTGASILGSVERSLSSITGIRDGHLVSRVGESAAAAMAASGGVYATEGAASAAARANGWTSTRDYSPGGRGRFYRDRDGNLWTRDRDGHNGGAWKKYDRTGRRRLGTYDEGLNRIRD